jgi:hypothetical protein
LPTSKGALNLPQLTVERDSRLPNLGNVGGPEGRKGRCCSRRIFCRAFPVANAYAEDELETTWREEEPEEEVEKETPPLPS